MKQLRILTWHVHGSYLYYLSKVPHEFYLPVNKERSNGFIGITPSYPWPANIKEVHVDDIKSQAFDCILFQSRENYTDHQHQLLAAEQLKLPKIFLEHDPPREHPTDTRHVVFDDTETMLVHCTHFNRLMWDSGSTATRVIEHGVMVPPDARYSGDRAAAVTVVNNIAKRGRRLGHDVFTRMRHSFPIDYVGMGYQEVDGLGEIPHHELPYFLSHYRLFFNPIRYTSMGLGIIEAMMVGLPVIGLATAELATVIKNGESGFIHTDVDQVAEATAMLLKDRELAREWGEGARRAALQRYNIFRFVNDWCGIFAEVTGTRSANSRLTGTALGVANDF